MDDDHLDRARQMIYLHQTTDRYGHLMNGLKGTHHIADEARRGRWTLFPSPLTDLLALRRSTDMPYRFPSPRGKFWSIRNFYRNVWEPPKPPLACPSRSMTSATPSRRASSPPVSRSSRFRVDGPQPSRRRTRGR